MKVTIDGKEYSVTQQDYDRVVKYRGTGDKRGLHPALARALEMEELKVPKVAVKENEAHEKEGEKQTFTKPGNNFKGGKQYTKGISDD